MPFTGVVLARLSKGRHCLHFSSCFVWHPYICIDLDFAFWGLGMEVGFGTRLTSAVAHFTAVMAFNVCLQSTHLCAVIMLWWCKMRRQGYYAMLVVHGVLADMTACC